MSTTPNMSLDLPVPSVDTGPGWANKEVAAFQTVDSHDHTAGKGVKIPSAGINIDATLQANSNTISELRSTQYDNQSAALTGVAEANSVQIVQGDLWVVNGAGTPVQVTSGSSVVAASSSNTPAGIVLPYAGSSAPAGYLMADGTAISRSTYATLFGVIGTTYGVGDGSTTFNVPNLIGRTPIGAGTYTDPVSGSLTRTLGQTLGAEKHVLTTSEMPSHDHGGGSHTHNLDAHVFQNTGNSVATGNGTVVGTAATASSGTIINSEGSDTAHNIMQPSLGLNYIIKT